MKTGIPANVGTLTSLIPRVITKELPFSLTCYFLRHFYAHMFVPPSSFQCNTVSKYVDCAGVTHTSDINLALRSQFYNNYSVETVSSQRT